MPPILLVDKYYFDHVGKLKIEKKAILVSHRQPGELLSALSSCVNHLTEEVFLQSCD